MMVVVASYQIEKLKHRLTSQNTDYSNLHRMLNGVKFAQNILDMTIKPVSVVITDSVGAILMS